MANLVKPQIGRRVTVSILPSSDAKESVELDYRVFIPGNFSHSEPGKHKDNDGTFATRKIREIKNSRDFKNVLSELNPKLKIIVPNKLVDDPDAEMEVSLDIKDMKDFHPDEIVHKVKPLQQLMEARNRLKQLKLLVQKNPKIIRQIEEILKEGKGGIDDLLSKLAGGEGQN